MKTKNLLAAALVAGLAMISPATIAWGAYADVIQADNPIGYFRMNETVASGDLVSGAGGDGAIHNAAVSEPGPVVGDWWATFATGGFEETTGVIAGDGAVLFDTQRTAGHASTVPTGSSFTMEAWFMVDSEMSRAGGSIVSMGKLNVLGDLFDINVNGGLLGMHIRNGYSQSNPAGTTVVDDAAWHHVAMVFEPGVTSTTRVALYLDGAATPEIDLEVSQGWNSMVDTLVIGSLCSYSVADKNQFVGGIDEVAVYGAALTPGQIAAHYQAVPEPATLSLLAIGGLAMMRRRRR